MTIENNQVRPGFDVVLIGMDGRFPGAENLEIFWDNQKNAVESISFFIDEELEDSGVSPGSLKIPNFV